MKLPPDIQKLEDLLRSSTIVAGGFLGDDQRPLPEIIEADTAAVARLGYTLDEIGARMSDITEKARAGQGMIVTVDDSLDALVDDNRGRIICPWPGEDSFLKTTTTVARSDTGVTLRWSDLSIHLIRVHGFFQGHGSPFRLDPELLVQTIFSASHPEHLPKYVCQVCGNVYSPEKGDRFNTIPPGTAFKDLPDTWRCPMCGAPKRMYKRQV